MVQTTLGLASYDEVEVLVGGWAIFGGLLFLQAAWYSRKVLTLCDILKRTQAALEMKRLHLDAARGNLTGVTAITLLPTVDTLSLCAQDGSRFNVTAQLSPFDARVELQVEYIS